MRRSVGDLLAAVKSSELRDGFAELLVPGERAARQLQECRESGVVELDDRMLEEIRCL